MDTVQNFKCPCCASVLMFSANNQMLHCDSCGNDYALDTLEELDIADSSVDESNNAYDWDNYIPREFSVDDSVNLSDYRCPSCSAEICGDDTLASSVCPYCGNPTIIKSQFAGALKPDYIIPFKINKKTAISIFRKKADSAPFIPDEFKSKSKIEEINGVYVPYFMFDCDCEASVTYNAKRISFWSDSKYNYTKTDFYRLLRKGKASFRNIPADASKKADDAYMETVEPFNVSDAVNFDTSYLPGFFADKFDVSRDECLKRTNSRAQATVTSLINATTAGFSGVVPQKSQFNISGGKIRYAMLPVWMLNIKYNDMLYKFAINGQTTKIAGAFPVDKKKRRNYFFKTFAISLAVCGLLIAALLLV